MTTLFLIDEDITPTTPEPEAVAAAGLPVKDKEAHNSQYWRTRCLVAESKVAFIDTGSCALALEFYAASGTYKRDSEGQTPISQDKGRRARVVMEALETTQAAARLQAARETGEETP